MKLHSILFLLTAILNVSDACLAIRYSKPPACVCKSLKLDSSNIKENEVKDNDLYDLVLSSEVKSPEILIDDCSVQVHCEDGSELYIFDTDKGAKIGDYSLDGFCDPYQKKWQVDTGNGMEQYKELKGVCVIKKTVTCSPADPATFLYAYSNDLDYIDMHRAYAVWADYGSGLSVSETKYATAATVRFDTKVKEDIVFHEGDTAYDSYIAAYSYLNETQVDPSKRFDSSETGSDILDVLERFIDTDRPNICGSVAFIFMKRSPNEIEISKIVEKIRAYHIMLSIAVKIPSSGGLHPETMYNLAAKTNGICSFSNFLWNAVMALPTILYSQTYYSANLKLSGTGSVNLPPMSLPAELSMYSVFGLQSTATAVSFQNMTLRWSDAQGVHGSLSKTREDMNSRTYHSMNTFKDLASTDEATQSTMRLEYDYSTEDTFLIRYYADKPTDQWSPYQD
ncbi:hypothetical protein B9Z55_003405 [Caenorhabditis nigoni]|uniref:DUF7154 domain-containing protein n=1 Tax=Caenorhabditis nigoni TaxID=1611254 RepID=A0A2G5VQ84_9PELO|nr:hypothetical protein B9Z55_003405 [Caenorhabditis nigoni]